MKYIPVIITMSVIVLSGIGASMSAQGQGQTPNALDKYKVIFERNIFSKDRLPPRENRPGGTQVKIKVLAIYILRGVAAEGERKIAFIEEQISGQSMRAQIGTELPEGRITDIRFDRVTFEENGQIRYVGIGGEFGKKETTEIVSSAAAEETPSTPPPQEQGDESAPVEEDEMLKKLMERRKSELGQ